MFMFMFYVYLIYIQQHSQMGPYSVAIKTRVYVGGSVAACTKSSGTDNDLLRSNERNARTLEAMNGKRARVLLLYVGFVFKFAVVSGNDLYFVFTIFPVFRTMYEMFRF